MANELQFILYSIDQEDRKVKVAIKDFEKYICGWRIVGNFNYRGFLGSSIRRVAPSDKEYSLL